MCSSDLGLLGYIGPQGRELWFEDLKPGQKRYSIAEQVQLTRSPGGHYYLSYPADGLIYAFGPRLTHLDGERLRLQSCCDLHENTHDFLYDEAGLLREVSTSAGYRLRFHYHGASAQTARLRRIDQIAVPPVGESPQEKSSVPAEAILPTPLVSYRYSDEGDLVAVLDRTGNTQRSFAYQQHIMVEQHFASGLRCGYQWDQLSPEGRVIEHWIDDATQPNALQERYRFRYGTPNDDGLYEVECIDHLNRRQHWICNADQLVTRYTNPLGQHYELDWNEHKRLTRHSLPDGGQWRFTYDARGQLVTICDPLNRNATLRWEDRWGKLARLQDFDGSLWQCTYDDRGNLTEIAGPNGWHQSMTYDARGLPALATDARGGVKRFTWDARALLRSHTDCSGQTTRYSYDGYGHLTRVTDALGQITTFTHDPLGRLRGQSLPDGAHHAYDYDGAGRLTGATDPLSRTSHFAWNALGQLTVRQDAEGRQIELHYDKAGRLSDLINENGAAYRFTYDAADRLSEEHRPDGTRLSIQYDANGAPILLTRTPGIGDEIDEKTDEEAPILPNPSDPAGRTAETGVHRGLQNTASETRVNKGLQGSAPETPINSGLAGSLPSPDESGLPQHTHLIRDAAGRLIEKRTAHHLYRYAYDAADRLTEARKFALVLPEAPDTAGLSSAYPTPPRQSTAETGVHRELQNTAPETRVNKGLQGSAPETPVNSGLAGALPGDKPPEPKLTPLHSVCFAYDALGRLIEERATDETCGQTHTLRHEHDALGNRTRTLLPTLPEEDALRALNYLYYGSGHLHQINFSYQRAGEETPRHQLIADIERDALHRETARSQGALRTRYALDPLGRRLGLWSQSADFSPEQPLAANDEGWLQALARAGQSIHARAGQSTNSRRGQHPSPASHPLDGLIKAYIYDKAGELRRVRHSARGDTLYAYDATGRITNKATSVNTISNETFAYDPAGNLLDPSSQMALSRRSEEHTSELQSR